MSTTEKPTIDLTAMLPRITEEVAAQLRQRALQSLEYQATNAVSEAVKAYITENILPAVCEELKAHDEELRALFVASVVETTKAMAEQVHAHALKKMTGYDGERLLSEFMGKLFGRGY